jgi:hypothetical protein
MNAPEAANFGWPAANARKQADAQIDPRPTAVGIFPSLMTAAIRAPSKSLPPWRIQLYVFDVFARSSCLSDDLDECVSIAPFDPTQDLDHATLFARDGRYRG